MNNMETGNEKQNVNIAEILRYAPKGLKLYSPIFGEMEFEKIDEINCIQVRDKYKNPWRFYEYGTYLNENNFSEGECLLFPSASHRCWNHWQNTLFLESIGSVCVDTITGYKFILGEEGTYFGDNTGSSYHFLIDDEDASNYLLNSRYATPEETKEFFDELEKNGYKWDGKKVVKKGNIKPKFKVGDIIRHKDTGIFFAIAEVKDDCYYSKGKTCLLFKYQDKWELVGSKEEVVPQDKIPTSLEVNYAVNNIKSLGNKVSVLADEIIALKERVKALEIQEIKRCSDKKRLDSLESKMIILDSHNINNRLDALESSVLEEGK